MRLGEMKKPDQHLMSIIVPTYNRTTASGTIEEYISALDNAFRGSESNYQIIVVDDGSEEKIRRGTRQQLEGFSNVSFYESEKNLGPGLARDYGVGLCSGDWVWFLDDDDRLDQRGLDLLINILDSPTVNVDIVAHSLRHSYPEADLKLISKIQERVLFFREKQEVFNYVFKREFLLNNNIQFSEGLHEDISYMYQVFANATGLRLLPEAVVLKNSTPGAITSSMTKTRIDGYLKTFLEVIRLSSDHNNTRENFFDASELFSQTLGVILYCIIREDDETASSLLIYLEKQISIQSELSKFFLEMNEYGINSPNFKYASSFWRLELNANTIDVLGGLRSIFLSRLSCKDLDSSLFLGPDEIRACCKRFFVENERKGDVVLLAAHENISLESISDAKEDLIGRINAEEAVECLGCPYIERRHSEEAAIDYISLENFSFCNMRCTYCSPKYYGGAEAKYNAADIVEQLAIKKRGLSSSCHVVWGGGEPTLSPRFDTINEYLLSRSEITKIRVLSNSLKYSNRLRSLLEDHRVQLVTSIDAGTPLLFREIRGKGDVSSVIKNLKIYHSDMKQKRRLTIKYILTPTNASSNELASFVSLVEEAGLMEAMFQVSCDFTLESASDLLVCAMYELAVRLYASGAKIVFFDDLIRDRVKLGDIKESLVRDHLDRNSLNLNFVNWSDSGYKILLWGRGLQARWLSNSTNCGDSGLIIGSVSNYAEYFKQKKAQDVSDFLICPSGVQSMYEIYQNIDESGLGHKILRGVLI